MSIVARRLGLVLLVLLSLAAPGRADKKHPIKLNIGFDPLYAVDGASLYRINVQNGQSVKVADLSETVYWIASDQRRGILYALVSGVHGRDLAKIDPHTGAIHHIGSTNNDNIGGLAYNQVNNLLYTCSSSIPAILMTIDPLTGDSTPLGGVGGYPLIAFGFDTMGNYYETMYLGDPRDRQGYLFWEVLANGVSGTRDVRPMPSSFAFDRWGRMFGIGIDDGAFYAYTWNGGTFTGTRIADRIPGGSFAFLPALAP